MSLQIDKVVPRLMGPEEADMHMEVYGSFNDKEFTAEVILGVVVQRAPQVVVYRSTPKAPGEDFPVAELIYEAMECPEYRKAATLRYIVTRGYSCSYATI